MNPRPQRSLSRSQAVTSPSAMGSSSRSDSRSHPPKNSAASAVASTNVTFIVNGTHFLLNREAVEAHPETLMGKMVSSSPITDIVRHNDRGDYIINTEFSPDFFRVALDYYKQGYITCPPDVPLSDLRDLCDYLMIPFNANTVKSYDLRALLHEIANDGARKHFEDFLESKVMPSIVQRALKGERECNVVILLDNEQIEWNPKLPPPSGEAQSQVIQSTAMHGFFKYLENRDVAKSVLVERGFKKVCLGIEGFPTHIDRIRTRQDGKLEASYFYVQRPFIRLSWEKEDARSRHVDFQCIRSRSRSAGSLAAAAMDLPLDDVIVNIPINDPVDVEHEPEPDFVQIEQPEQVEHVVVEEGALNNHSDEEEEHD